jgi:hypothetical protein
MNVILDGSRQKPEGIQSFKYVNIIHHHRSVIPRLHGLHSLFDRATLRCKHGHIQGNRRIQQANWSLQYAPAAQLPCVGWTSVTDGKWHGLEMGMPNHELRMGLGT